MGQLLEESKKLAGLLLINKPIGITSFSLIPKLRYLFKEKKDWPRRNFGSPCLWSNGLSNRKTIHKKQQTPSFYMIKNIM